MIGRGLVTAKVSYYDGKGSRRAGTPDFGMALNVISCHIKCHSKVRTFTSIMKEVKAHRLGIGDSDHKINVTMYAQQK